MRQSKTLLAAAAAIGMASHFALAADYTWLSFAGGTYAWNAAGVWAPGGFPSLDGDTANLSGPIAGGPLNVALPSNVTLTLLTVGGTAGPFTTDIGAANAGGGVLSLENAAGAGAATIATAGVPAAVTNITAPVQLGASVVAIGASTLQASNFRVEGTSPVNFLGGLRLLADANAADGTLIQRRVLTLNVASLTTGSTYTFGNIVLAQPGAVQRGDLQITSGGLQSPMITFAHGGTVVFNGSISDGGFAGGQVLLGYGSSANSQPTVPTRYVFNQDNTYTGPTNLSRGHYLLNVAQPFGTGQINVQYAANTYGANLVSDSDTRAIANNIQFQNNLTVSGERSLTLNGFIYQSNNRELTNILPDGKTLTINGFIAPATSGDGGSETARAFTFDGPGNTVVNGPIYNHRNPWFPGSTGDAAMDRAVDPAFGAYGGIAKRGTGVVTINSTVLPTITDGSTSFTGPSSTLLGPTSVAGGLLQFASPAAYGKLASWSGGSLSITNNPGTSRINVIAGGAIGVLDGTITPDFLGKLNASTMAVGNSGGLALAQADAAKNLDFTAGDMAGAGVVGMSVGAVAAGVSYTGTITPPAGQNYRLGGGGTLTLPDANQLTGARGVTVTNGGAVALANLNNYTGVTTVRGDYIQTAEVQARTDANSNALINAPYAVRVNSTLVVSHLANGGANSSVGASSSAAQNLVLQGATLKYVGAGGASDRLFTIGSVGATLDASGTGALTLTNAGAVAVADAPARAGTLATGGNARLITGLPDVSDLTPGMSVVAEFAGAGTFLPADAVVQGITVSFGFTGGSPFNPVNQISVSAGAVAAASGATLRFSNQDRDLTLTGTNTGANTLAALLTDSAAGKLGVVKTGPGNWSLTGDNTFTGGVTVRDGRLTLNRVRNGVTTISGGTLRIADGAVGNAGNTSVFGEGQYAQTGGRFDLNKSGAVFDYATTSPLGDVRGLIASAYAGGNWGGSGITSSAAAAAAGASSHAVGYAEAADLGSPATFLGQPVDSTAVLVRYTRQGDANLDGVTGIADFSLLAASFNQPGTTWSRGDFNYDGTTNIGDFSLLGGNFNQAATTEPLARSAVPEPTLAAAAAAALLLTARRRRR